MQESGKEISDDTLIVEIASFLELLRDHRFAKEDWTQCETCRQNAEDLKQMFSELL